jgi:hypothetical protein
LVRYAGECLAGSFSDSGYALQDIVNEVGRRLGFSVTDGRYRGTSAHVGFDGLWHFPKNGHALIVEVKTTDAYRIKLEKIMGYHSALIKSEDVFKDSSSVLIIVGRQDTGDLEAQIRGSRYAWDIRLISVDGILRLMALKESVEDPVIARRIHDILVPREFTRLDEIVEILFSTAEDIKQEEEMLEEAEDQEIAEQKPKFTPVAFHDACVVRIQNLFNRTLLKRSRATFSSSDGSLALICAVSKEHDNRGQPSYWFAFHPHQKEFLDSAQDGYIAFGCGSEEHILLIPFDSFSEWLDGMNKIIQTAHQDQPNV